MSVEPIIRVRCLSKWFGEVVAEAITVGGTDRSRLPALIPTILQRAADFSTGAAAKAF